METPKETASIIDQLIKKRKVETEAFKKLLSAMESSTPTVHSDMPAEFKKKVKGSKKK